MDTEMKIEITKTQSPKAQPEGALGFGQYFTDHMFIMDYEEGLGWHSPRIAPFGTIEFSPAMSVFHYGQATFEGMKAYRGAGDEIFLFRPEMNARRSNASNTRMSIPEIPEADYLQAVKMLVQTDADWIPRAADASLYIRPFFIATDPVLGLNISKTYKFMVILCPCDAFFGTLQPVDIWIEDEYVRAVRGGTGRAKTSGNYAASMAAQSRAKAKGYAQVMWLDGVERKYIEEVGAMNIFFKIDGKVITPALNGSILEGVTRDSIIKLCRDFGLTIEECPITIDEIFAAADAGTLEEVFGTGTAVTISPVSRLRYREKEAVAGNGTAGELAKKLYNTLASIQRGEGEDKFNWRHQV